MADLSSPWARVEPGSRVKEGAPAIQRPTKEQIASFPQEANDLIDSTWAAQKPLIDESRYDASWLDGQHLVIVGGTGRGLGGAVSVIGLHNLAGKPDRHWSRHKEVAGIRIRDRSAGTRGGSPG